MSTAGIKAYPSSVDGTQPVRSIDEARPSAGVISSLHIGLSLNRERDNGENR